MKRKITASLLVAVILIFSAKTRLISYAADSSEESIVSRVTEFIAVYNTLYNGDAWTDRFPEARKAGTVSVNGTECYVMDYNKVLDYMKTVFTDDTAEDMLHRNRNGFIYADGKMYLIDAYVAVQTPKILFGDSEKLTSDAYSLSIDGDTATMKLTFTIPSNVFDENSEKTVHKDASLTFRMVNGNWRISGGTMIDILYKDHKVLKYDPQNPPTDSSFPSAFAVTAAAASIKIPLLRKKRKNPA